MMIVIAIIHVHVVYDDKQVWHYKVMTNETQSRQLC